MVKPTSIRSRAVMFVLSMAACTSISSQRSDSAESSETATETDTSSDSRGPHAGTGSASGRDADSTADSAVDPTDSGTKLDVGSTDIPPGNCPEIQADAVLSGTVLAPDGALPIAGAVVFVSEQRPQGIPQNVYCDECQVLDCSSPYALTDVDGSFDLPVATDKAKFLAVRKGQFMRVTEVELKPGATLLDDALTTLPGVNDPDHGLYIPKMVVAWAEYDSLENLLAKIGLAGVQEIGGGHVAMPGTESFDIFENGESATSEGFEIQGSMEDLVTDPEVLDRYHIIFVPCTDPQYNHLLDDPAVVANIRSWVEKGGRWYASDYSNDWVEKVFPEYQSFVYDPEYDDNDLSAYDSLGTVLDPGLIEWLGNLPPEFVDINPANGQMNPGIDPFPTLGQLPQVLTVDNYSAIDQLFEVVVEDGSGGMVNVGHKVWVEGPGDGDAVSETPHPLTVSGQYGCGKVQFTTYHTVESGPYFGLTPQELVLVYTILEIGVCQTPYPAPAG